MLWVALIAVAIAALGIAWAARRSKTPGASDAAAESSTDEEPLPEWVSNLESLVALNLALRENALPDAATAKLESIIDRLRNLIPELNERHAGSELAWTVNRMSTDYLNRVVQPYVGLSSSAREEQLDPLIESLRGLESELESIEGLVKNNQEGEFTSKAAFLKARFLEDKL